MTCRSVLSVLFRYFDQIQTLLFISNLHEVKRPLQMHARFSVKLRGFIYFPCLLSDFGCFVALSELQVGFNRKVIFLFATSRSAISTVTSLFPNGLVLPFAALELSISSLSSLEGWRQPLFSLLSLEGPRLSVCPKQSRAGPLHRPSSLWHKRCSQRYISGL